MSARNSIQTNTTAAKPAKPTVGNFSWGLTQTGIGNPMGMGGNVAATYSTAVTVLA